MGANLPAQPIVALVGPTGVGKTDAGVSLCERFGGELVGADSIQVYRGFDIGSSKPDTAALRGVRHHLLDVCEPDEDMDAMRYAGLADAAISDIAARGRVPVVVGGTGLWLRALLRGLLDLPPVDPALRRSLEARFDAEGPDRTHAALAAIDPRSAAQIHPNDRMRVVRALEVHAQTGQALGELRHGHALGEPRFNALTLCLDVPPAHYRPTLETRARAMLDAGWVAEVQGLLARYGGGLRPLTSVGYRQVCEHIERAHSDEDTLSAIVSATATYARRQRTWFGSDPSVDLRTTPAELRATDTLRRIESHLATDSGATIAR